MRESLERFLREHRYAAVNLTIAALQVIVFIVNTAMHGALFPKGMLSASAVAEDHEYWRLFTVVFLHADFMHLMSNLVGQIAIGNTLEKLYGHLRFFLLYFLCTVCASLCSVAHGLRTFRDAGSVGSSGAVFGLMGALVVLILMGRGLYGGARIRERAIFILVYSVYVGFQSTGIDNAAHVGGMLTGLIAGFILARTASRPKYG